MSLITVAAIAWLLAVHANELEDEWYKDTQNAAGMGVARIIVGLVLLLRRRAVTTSVITWVSRHVRGSIQTSLEASVD